MLLFYLHFIFKIEALFSLKFLFKKWNMACSIFWRPSWQLASWQRRRLASPCAQQVSACPSAASPNDFSASEEENKQTNKHKLESECAKTNVGKKCLRGSLQLAWPSSVWIGRSLSDWRGPWRRPVSWPSCSQPTSSRSQPLPKPWAVYSCVHCAGSSQGTWSSRALWRLSLGEANLAHRPTPVIDLRK